MIVEIRWLFAREGQPHAVEHPLCEPETKEEWVKDYVRAVISRVVGDASDGTRIVESSYLLGMRIKGALWSMSEAVGPGLLHEFLISIGQVSVSFVPAAVVVEVFLTMPPEQLRLWR